MAGMCGKDDLGMADCWMCMCMRPFKFRSFHASDWSLYALRRYLLNNPGARLLQLRLHINFNPLSTQREIVLHHDPHTTNNWMNSKQNTHVGYY